MLFSMAVSEAVPGIGWGDFLLPGQIISAYPGVKPWRLSSGVAPADAVRKK